MVRVGIAGVNGRLGQLVAREALGSGAATVAGGLTRPGQTLASVLPAGIVRFEDASALARACDVLIDVSHPSAVAAHAEAVRQAGIAWVVGVSGIDGAGEAAIDRAAREVPLLVAANFAPGVSLVLALAAILGAACPGTAYDAEIVETHHRGKRDAPSGTALAIGRAVAAGRGVDLDAVAVRGRDGDTGPREDGTIGFASLRAGAVVGEHTLVLASATEEITLGHRAFDRTVFAEGAVRAALWLAGRAAGRYAMTDVLGVAPGAHGPG